LGRYDRTVRESLAVRPGVRSLLTGLRRWPAVGILAAAGFMTAMTFPAVTAPAEAGLDPSWRIGLELAAAERLDFGREIVFTYGPLGFLILPHLIVTWVSVLAFVYTIASGLLLAGTLLYSALKSFHPFVAVPVAYVLAWAPLDRGSVLVVCVLVWGVLALQGAVRPEVVTWLAPIGAVVASVEMLIKFHAGATALGIVLVTAWLTAPAPRRTVPLAAGVAVVTVLLLFLASGSSLTGLADWVQSQLEVTEGYSAGAALEQPGLEWQYFAAGALVTVLVLLVTRQTTPLGRARQATALSFVAVLAFGAFKLGFVRHAGDHPQFFFAFVAIAGLAASWTGEIRWAALATSMIALVIAIQTSSIELRSLAEPGTRVRAAAAQARTLLTSSRRQTVVEAGRRSIRDNLQVEPEVLRKLAGRTVHIDPYEGSAAWGYGLRWRPIPAFQRYIAYTVALDRKNAEYLNSADAPERILRIGGSVGLDGSYLPFEAPETFFTMLCRYRQASASQRWQALARRPNRCGPPRLIHTDRLSNGDTVSVPSPPRPNDLVYARLRTSPSLGSRLRDFVYKPLRAAEVTLDESARYRYAAATASDAHVLHVPGSLGYSAPFDGRLDTRTLLFEGLDNPSQIEFYAVSVGE
jgi:hypothetical protein